MAYPQIRYKGQYTLKRVLTMPADPSLTKDDIGKLVTPNSNGVVVLPHLNVTFFGILRSINTNDNVCTVDFSGIHQVVAKDVVEIGAAVIPNGSNKVITKPTSGSGMAPGTIAIALEEATADGDEIAIFFLN